MTNTKEQTTTLCAVNPTAQHKPSYESKTKKLIRKAKQLIAPTHAKVRFDTTAGAWAVLETPSEDEVKALRHFDFGVMTNVKFSTKKVSSANMCIYGENIGIAEGDLRENIYSIPGNQTGFRNLAFNGQNFVNPEGEIIQEASVLRLMGARTAVYRP